MTFFRGGAMVSKGCMQIKGMRRQCATPVAFTKKGQGVKQDYRKAARGGTVEPR